MNNHSVEDLKKAEKYCLRLLSLRSRSECEIKSKLEKKGYSEQCRLDLLSKLKKKKFIDDKALAEGWIASRMKFHPRSGKLLRKELIAKGISPDVVEKALEQAGEVLDDRRLSLKLAEEFLRKMQGDSSDKKKAKLFRLLLSRGFDPEISEETVNTVVG